MTNIHSPLPSTADTARPERHDCKWLLSRPDLAKLGISYSRAHLWRLICAGQFPAPVALGPAQYARKCWRRKDVEDWLAHLPLASYASAKPRQVA